MIVFPGTNLRIAECLCGCKLYCGDSKEPEAVKYAVENGWKINLDENIEMCPKCYCKEMGY